MKKTKKKKYIISYIYMYLFHHFHREDWITNARPC
jgi:hypothetical protein